MLAAEMVFSWPGRPMSIVVLEWDPAHQAACNLQSYQGCFLTWIQSCGLTRVFAITLVSITWSC